MKSCIPSSRTPLSMERNYCQYGDCLKCGLWATNLKPQFWLSAQGAALQKTPGVKSKLHTMWIYCRPANWHPIHGVDKIISLCMTDIIHLQHFQQLIQILECFDVNQRAGFPLTPFAGLLSLTNRASHGVNDHLYIINDGCFFFTVSCVEWWWWLITVYQGPVMDLWRHHNN